KFLAFVDRHLQHFTFRREPEAVVYELGIFGHTLVLEVGGSAVQCDRFDAAVGGKQDCSTRRLIHTARLHADETVLDEIESADAVGAAEIVEVLKKNRRGHFLAIDRDGIATFEVDRYDRWFVRRLLRIDCAGKYVVRHVLAWILKHFSLGRGVQQVRIDRKRRFAALIFGNWNLMPFSKLDELGPRGQIPLSPRRDYRHIWLERIVGQLEADLIVAFAGCAMCHRIGADFLRNLDLLFGDQRPRDGRAKQVLPLIQSICPEHRKNVVPHKILAQIFYEDIFLFDAKQ